MSPILQQIEQSIRALSVEEQLWLLERIAHELRQKTQFAALPIAGFDMETQLAEMANDPAIQAELAAIKQEFAFTEMDPKRFPSQPAGQLSEAKMQEVEGTVRYCLGL
ncbi:MAG: hypothetical protein HC875_31525 [Anaerolineales bacterium]|nr:hypothetical protein [Anaerolineales bacterium]